MKNFLIAGLLLSILIVPLAGTFAQERDTSVATTQQQSSEELPDFLKEFVKKYERQKKTDTITGLNDNIISAESLLNNLVMDNTLSKMGHDFYEYFYEQWDPPETDQQFTVHINEKPAPGMGNMVMIKINYDEVFQSRLSPRQRAIEKIAQQAVGQSENYIANYEQIKQQLEGADMKGSGIY